MGLFGRKDKDGTASADDGGREAIAAFWDWWSASGKAEAAELFAGRGDQERFDAFGEALGSRVRAIADLAVATGPGHDAKHCLVLTAGGDPDLRDVAARWLAAAPPVDEDFEYADHRQAHPDPTSLTLRFDGGELDLASTLDADVDVAVAVVGEKAYAEFEGDRPDGVTLPDGDLAVLDELERMGIPTVVVVVSGRPIDLHGAERWAGAVVAAWLPGSEGAGVVDVLMGVVEPAGTLPMSWPRPGDTTPVNSDDTRPALFPFGAGLTSWD